MKSNLSFFPRLSCAWGAIAAAVLFLPALDTQGALTHRYSFSNGVTDSVGEANGTIQGDVTVSGGVATFPGIANTDYIELPSGLITNYTSVTFELWVDVLDNGNWEELFAFGNQTAGGEGANMVMFTPHSGSAPPDFRMSYAQSAPGYNDERVVNGVGILDNVGPTSVTCVFDPPNSSMSLYTNGTLVATLSPVPATGAKGFSLTNVYDVHCWLGRSLYNNDAPYNGTIDEFRIYNEALGPLQIFASGRAGPDTIVTNVTVSSLTWNTESTMTVGNKQPTTVTFNTADYGSVTLAGATEATYASSNPSIVQVNNRGVLVAKAVGSASVSAAYGGTTNSVTITVTEPQLVHRYTFNSDANDSIGTANGKLVNGATVSGGAVVLPGGTTSSDPAAAYVDLPNNLLTNFTAITLEAWVTDNESGNWARVWDLGNSAEGEDVPGTGSRYMFLALPTAGGLLASTIRINDRVGGENYLEWPAWAGGRPPVGEKAHVAWSTDFANSTSWLYVNGALVDIDTNTVITPADIGPSVNNWLGRSQYANDAAFSGTIDEFRIYNGPLSPLQIALNAATGPENTITNPGPVQSLQLKVLGTNTLAYGGDPVLVAAIANFQNVSNVNVSAVPGTLFQSSAVSVVTAGPSGQLTAQDVGTATITATYGGQTATLPLTIASLSAPATMVHRYSFSETSGTTVKDTAGTADGTIKGEGATLAAGQVTLPGGGASNADPVPGYVDLPNGIISALSDLSIEAWVTWQGSGNWQRIFDFGTSAGGEDISDGNGNYIFLATNPFRFSPRDPVTGTEPAQVNAAVSPLETGREVYVAVTYDHTHNSAKLYVDGALAGSSTAPVDITTIEDVNNWLGRSQWPDPVFQGKFNEFRIWNGVLLPNEIGKHFAAGPDSLEPVATPKLAATVSNNNLILSWPESAGFVLESSATLGQGATWTAVTGTPTTANGVQSVGVPIGAGTQFYRLRK